MFQPGRPPCRIAPRKYGGMPTSMIILGIETSCDETAAAVVSAERRILANRVLSQIADHRPFGGIVPEIAARAHLDHLDTLIVDALDEAGVTFSDLSGIAATAGPGLIGGVIVGVTMAKAMAFANRLPFIAVNHLEAHALTARLSDDVAFPYLLLLVTGGHTQLLVVEGVGRYRRLGTTVDDAVGEAFDKAAKLLGLGYPGGPAIEALAQRGNAARAPAALPRPMIGRPGCDFSFSGLKTALSHVVRARPQLSAEERPISQPLSKPLWRIPSPIEPARRLNSFSMTIRPRAPFWWWPAELPPTAHCVPVSTPWRDSVAPGWWHPP